MLFLIIDDDDLSRELLTLLLSIEGCEVEAVCSGEEALSRLSVSRPLPDVILTDLQMPGLAGASLAQALKLGPASSIPVLAMSGSKPHPASCGEGGIPIGFDGFLLKPFTFAELQVALKAATLTAAQGDSEAERAANSPRAEATTAVDDGPEIPILNDEIFCKLRELMPAAQLGQMYALCVADARIRLESMTVSASVGDDAAYRREAHAIKGGAGMIGASELHDLAGFAEAHGLGAAPPRDTSAGISPVTASLAGLSDACLRLERILVERLRN